MAALRPSRRLAAPLPPGPGSPSLRSREVFGFRGGRGDFEGNFRAYDWSLVSTVAWFSSDALTCEAHAHGARAVLAAPDPLPINEGDGAEARAAWVAGAVAAVQARFMDGIVFDYEAPVEPRSALAANYVALVNETARALHDAIPGSQVSVCLAWSLNGIDGRWYDNLGLAEAADVAYVMMYDTRSQIFDQCVASANAAFPATQLGVQQYLALGVDPGKIILGVPWYGYDYPCLMPMDPQSPTCSLRLTPFRGVNCSDAAGTQVAYMDIMARLARNATATGRRWDGYLKAPWYNYLDVDGVVHQVWWDDPESLRYKYALARDLGLRGVGPYTFDDLDFDGAQTGSASATDESEAMWAALRVIVDGAGEAT